MLTDEEEPCKATEPAPEEPPPAAILEASSSSASEKGEFYTSLDVSLKKSSILSSSKSSVTHSGAEAPKKKVSFLHVNINEKENLLSDIALTSPSLDPLQRHLKMAEHSRQLYGLHNQTRFSSFTRTRSSLDLKHLDKGLRSRSWLNLR